jgi:hypothetical protein
MYRVRLGTEIRPGKFQFSGEVDTAPYSGVSSQPLLDACRAIKRMGGDTRAYAALFRAGRSDWVLRVKVGVGAGLTVVEKSRCFAKFQEFDPSWLKNVPGAR